MRVGSAGRTWLFRLATAAGACLLILFLVVIPVGGSLLITDLRFEFPDPAPDSTFPLPLEDVTFPSSDNVTLRGWWSAQPGSSRGTVVFVHGLNRSRMEMLDPAAATWSEGFSTLLFDLRNHGESQGAVTSLGVRESDDVCQAARFVRSRDPNRPVVLWGVSLGAASALLGARCAGAAAVIADSSFLSFEETVRHHFRQVFRLPSFPIADLVIMVTRLRAGIARGEGDVEAAVRQLPDVPVLFVTGGRDWRMPPELAARLAAASAHSDSTLVEIPAATHGHAFETDPDKYMAEVVGFLDRALRAPE